MTEPVQKVWKNLNKEYPQCAHYSILTHHRDVEGMDALRDMFPEPVADSMNVVLFSTSGIHGTYHTIEEAEQHIHAPTEETFGEVTFLVLQPRLVALRYGCCNPKTQDDIDYLKRLRASSHKALSEIGTP